MSDVSRLEQTNPRITILRIGKAGSGEFVFIRRRGRERAGLAETNGAFTQPGRASDWLELPVEVPCHRRVTIRGPRDTGAASDAQAGGDDLLGAYRFLAPIWGHVRAIAAVRYAVDPCRISVIRLRIA